jgi:hypothetical protein
MRKVPKPQVKVLNPKAKVHVVSLMCYKLGYIFYSIAT